MQRKVATLGQGQRTLIVPITSDRGLCGGINSSIVREVKYFINHSPNRNNFEIFCIGEKGVSALVRPFPDLLKNSVSDVSVPLNFSTINAISNQINSSAKDCDKVIIYFNEFKSAISTIIRQLEILPKEKFNQHMSFNKLYELKPDKHVTNPALFDFYFASNLYHAYLNNLASEQSARMTAMENASKNAREIVEKLLLQYNKARQARITMELVEIISGASAV
jgi:F-type H+-transporting ATPase subunit gamma